MAVTRGPDSSREAWTFLNYFRNVGGVLAFVVLLLAVLAPSHS
jgi:hypothetical protein